MANLPVRDASGTSVYVKSTGTGAGGDPYIPAHSVTVATAGDIVDGADVTKGAKADTAITDPATTNTLMSFLKGLVKILADVWDSTNHLLHQDLKQVGGTAVDVNSGNKSNGTIRVTIATDQVALTNALLVDTEMPAAAALADGASNPTSPMIGCNLLVYNGATWDRLRAANKRVDMSAVSVSSIATLLTPTSGKKFRLMGGCLSLSAAGNLLFEDNTGGNFIFRTPKLLADTPYNFDIGQGFLSAAANNVLKGTASTTATVTGTLYYCEE